MERNGENLQAFGEMVYLPMKMAEHFIHHDVCKGSRLFSNSGLAVKLSVVFLPGSLFSAQ